MEGGLFDLGFGEFFGVVVVGGVCEFAFELAVFDFEFGVDGVVGAGFVYGF
ncbi:hypothetical protein KA119_02515 [Candidatus Gracilibacteria bacterium]|nr:hypothetical protein [Candidatus Gracilibacteria bacterium]